MNNIKKTIFSFIIILINYSLSNCASPKKRSFNVQEHSTTPIPAELPAVHKRACNFKIDTTPDRSTPQMPELTSSLLAASQSACASTSFQPDFDTPTQSTPALDLSTSIPHSKDSEDDTSFFRFMRQQSPVSFGSRQPDRTIFPQLSIITSPGIDPAKTPLMSDKPTLTPLNKPKRGLSISTSAYAALGELTTKFDKDEKEISPKSATLNLAFDTLTSSQDISGNNTLGIIREETAKSIIDKSPDRNPYASTTTTPQRSRIIIGDSLASAMLKSPGMSPEIRRFLTSEEVIVSPTQKGSSSDLK